MMFIQDENINEIIPKLKKRAKRLVSSTEDFDLEDLEIQLRFWFSKKYSIPMKSEVIESYTIPEMLLEFYMHEESGKDVVDVTEEGINESRDEIADMIAEEFSKEEEEFLKDTFGEDSNWSFSEE